MVRKKNRYIVLELLDSCCSSSAGRQLPSSRPLQRLDVSDEALMSAVTSAVQQLHGQHGLSCVRHRLTVKYCNALTRLALLRVSQPAHTLLASALALVTHVQGVAVTPRTIYTGGTLMHCYRFMRRHQLSQLERSWRQLAEHERTQLVQQLTSVQLLNTLEARGLPGAQC